MGKAVGNPVQPWRWAMHGRRDRWHVMLPAGDGSYKRALCGLTPPNGWGPMRAAPPSLDVRCCVTCYTRAYRQGAPIR